MHKFSFLVFAESSSFFYSFKCKLMGKINFPQPARGKSREKGKKDLWRFASAWEKVFRVIFLFPFSGWWCRRAYDLSRLLLFFFFNECEHIGLKYIIPFLSAPYLYECLCFHNNNIFSCIPVKTKKKKHEKKMKMEKAFLWCQKFFTLDFQFLRVSFGWHRHKEKRDVGKKKINKFNEDFAVSIQRELRDRKRLQEQMAIWRDLQVVFFLHFLFFIYFESRRFFDRNIFAMKIRETYY